MVNKMQTARGGGPIYSRRDFSRTVLFQISPSKKSLGKATLSDVDKSLVTEIVYGTVSRKLTLEWYLSHFVADRDQVDPWIYHLLLMSLYQFVYLEKIPLHAVVHEAVELAKQRKKGSEKYVNALLRKILREGLPSIDRIKRVNKRLSIRYSLPVWLVKSCLMSMAKSGPLRFLRVSMFATRPVFVLSIWIKKKTSRSNCRLRILYWLQLPS